MIVFAPIALTTYSLFLVICEPFKNLCKDLLDSYVFFNILFAWCGVSYGIYSYSSSGYCHTHCLVIVFVIISLTSPGVYIVICFLYYTITALHKLLAKIFQCCMIDDRIVSSNVLR